MGGALQQGMSGIQNLLASPVSFQPIREQAERGYRTRTLPAILERLGVSSGEGALHGSGAFEAMDRPAQDLQSNLAALESQFGLQQQGQQGNLLMQLLGLGMQPMDEEKYFPGQTSGISRFAGPMAGGIGQGLGALIPLLGEAAIGGAAGGPVGAAAGAGMEALPYLLRMLQGYMGGGQNQNQGVTYEQPNIT
jgi:hypothetical protein